MDVKQAMASNQAAPCLQRYGPSQLIRFAQRLDPGLTGRDFADAGLRLDQMTNRRFAGAGLSHRAKAGVIS